MTYIRVATARLPDNHWQDTFYTAHRNGPQHILVYLSDEQKFDEILSPIVKLLGENSTCSIRIVTPEKYHDSIRRRLYISARAKLRPNQAALNTLIRELHFFKPDEWQKIIYDTTTGETNAPYRMRYSAILLDRPAKDYAWLRKLIRNQNGVIYIPLAEQKEHRAKTLLKEAGFNIRYTRTTTQGMLCLSTSEFPLMVQLDGALPLWHKAGDANYLLPYDLNGSCVFCRLKGIPTDSLLADAKLKLDMQVATNSTPGSPWLTRIEGTVRKD